MAQVTQALTIEGQLHMDEAQKKIVKLPKYGEPTGKHYQHLINFLQGEHTKKTNVPYQMYGKFNTWSNSEEGDRHPNLRIPRRRRRRLREQQGTSRPEWSKV